jgi:energy-coupling factor transporter ATP-binding protein EcfA2
MANRNPRPGVDINSLVDLNCDHTLDAEQQAEARTLLHDAFGPYADPVLRACGRAAARGREADTLREQLGQLPAAPQLRGVVTGVHNGRVRLLLGGTERLLARPEGLTLGIGQTVLTDAEARRVVAAGDFLVGGQTYAFCERLEGRHALVRPLRDAAQDDGRQLALIADCVDLNTLTSGDRVLGWSLDYGNVVLVTRRLGALPPPIADDLGVGRPVRREDIVGLDDVIDEVDLLFLSSASPAYAALLRHVNRALAGVVLQGPTGCGKSTVAEYFVGAVRQRGGRALYRTASHYLSKWVGEGAARLRADFERLDDAYRDTKVRPLLVIDELEAIALDRSQPWALNAGHLEVLDTLLSLLTRTEARMVGISNVANRYLEAALVRDGRLRVVCFPATLGPEQVATLVAKCLAGIPLAADGGSGGSDALAREFGDALSDFIFAPAGGLAELIRVQLADGRLLNFGARDLASAAAIADGIVRPTVARATRRDLRAGRATPLPLDDLRTATLHYFAERCRALTRDNVRSVLPDRLPEDQAVVKVERLAPARPNIATRE